MLAESLEYLAIKPDGRYLDCTAGLGRTYGGHRRAADSGGKLIANDRDAQSLEMARRNTAEYCGPDRVSAGEFFGAGRSRIWTACLRIWA